MLQSAYFLAKIGADTAENEQHFAEILPKTGNYPTRCPACEKMAALRKKDREREAAWLAAQQDAEEWCIRLHISLQKRIFRRGNFELV